MKIHTHERKPLLSSNNANDEDASAESTMHMKSFITAAAANLYEYYDFALLGFFATEISDRIFPSGSGVSGIIEIYALYAVGFIARPFGGVVFGYFGDKYGRKFSLRMAMIFMSLPTFLTGCIPGYDYIGWWAPIILLILRVLQGLSTGGENSSAAIYIYETAPKDKRAFWLSLFGICSSGTLIASLFHVILQNVLNEQQLYHWGWRIPFLCGIGLLFLALSAKNWMKSTDTFCHLEASPYVHNNPITYAFSNSRALLLKFVLASALQHGAAYLIFVFLPTYLSSDLMRGAAHDGWTDQYIYSTNCINSLLFLPICVFVGYHTDRIGTLPFLCASCITVILTAPFLFYGLAISTSSIMNGVLQFLLILSCVPVWGCIFFWYIRVLLIDPRARVTIFGIGYNLGAAIFGGTASLIGTSFVSSMGVVNGMIGCGVWMSILAVLCISTVVYTVYDFLRDFGQLEIMESRTDMYSKRYEASSFTSTWYLNPKYSSLDAIEEDLSHLESSSDESD